MKALTVRQPWASLIIRGGKDIENRDWYTGIRGRVAIHTSAKLLKSEMDSACGLMRSFIPRFSRRIFERDFFPVGAIIGTVEIVDCVHHSDSPWFQGQYGFVLSDPRPVITPILCKGALGFWEVPTDVEAVITAEVSHATA